MEHMFLSMPLSLVLELDKHVERVITKRLIITPDAESVLECTYSLMHVSVINLRRLTLQPRCRIHQLVTDVVLI